MNIFICRHDFTSDLFHIVRKPGIHLIDFILTGNHELISCETLNVAKLDSCRINLKPTILNITQCPYVRHEKTYFLQYEIKC
jgi:hypothetical protein